MEGKNVILNIPPNANVDPRSIVSNIVFIQYSYRKMIDSVDLLILKTKHVLQRQHTMRALRSQSLDSGDLCKVILIPLTVNVKKPRVSITLKSIKKLR